MTTGPDAGCLTCGAPCLAGLASAACGALGRVAYVAPATVLPLAFSRFRSALNSANAAQQLVRKTYRTSLPWKADKFFPTRPQLFLMHHSSMLCPAHARALAFASTTCMSAISLLSIATVLPGVQPWAIGTLATCIRPLLLSGWGPGQGGPSVEVAGDTGAIMAVDDTEPGMTGPQVHLGWASKGKPGVQAGSLTNSLTQKQLLWHLKGGNHTYGKVPMHYCRHH
jgi:hypothetical protein